MNDITEDLRNLACKGGYLNEDQAFTFIEMLKKSPVIKRTALELNYGQNLYQELQEYAYKIAKEMMDDIAPWFDVFATELGFKFDEEIVDVQTLWRDEPTLMRVYTGPSVLELWIELDPRLNYIDARISSRIRPDIWNAEFQFEDFPRALQEAKAAVVVYYEHNRV